MIVYRYDLGDNEEAKELNLRIQKESSPEGGYLIVVSDAVSGSSTSVYGETIADAVNNCLEWADVGHIICEQGDSLENIIEVIRDNEQEYLTEGKGQEAIESSVQGRNAPVFRYVVAKIEV